MHLQKYKKVKDILLSLLPRDDAPLPSEEVCLAVLSQDQSLGAIKPEALRELVSSTLSTFHFAKQQFPSFQYADFIKAHENIMRFTPPPGRIEEQEYHELLGRYENIQQRLALVNGPMQARAEFELYLLNNLYHEAQRQVELAGLWVVPDGHFGKAMKHDDVIVAVTQKYPAVGLTGACYGITLTAAAELLKKGCFDRDAFLDQVCNVQMVDKVAFAQDYQQDIGATTQQLIETIEPSLLGRVESLSGILIKNEICSIIEYARELNKIPTGFPLAIMLNNQGVSSAHIILLHRDEANHWQAFDSNQMESLARSSDELASILFTAFYEDGSLAFSEAIYTVDSQPREIEYFRQRQISKSEKIVEMLQAEKNMNKKNSLLSLVLHHKDDGLLSLLLKGGVDPNSHDLKELMHCVMSGDLETLKVFLSVDEADISVTSENLKYLLRLSEMRSVLITQKQREEMSRYIRQELKARRILRAFERPGLPDLYEVHTAFSENDVSLLSRHVLTVKNRLEEVDEGEMSEELISIFNQQNPDHRIGIVSAAATPDFFAFTPQAEEAVVMKGFSFGGACED